MISWFEPPVKAVQDDGNIAGILRVVREAKQELVLVSPYNNYPGHLERAVKEAIDRGIPVTLVCRENHLGDSEQKERRHWETLQNLGAEVYLVKDLHAKIYYNESLAIVTSMNLHTSSASNSREFGFLIRDSEIREAYCHGCGEKRKAAFGRPISFNMPLCRSCHKEAASAT